jgi:hypothetical protein
VQWWKSPVAVSALVLAACGSASHGTTVTVTAAATPATTTGAATVAAPATTAPAAPATAPAATGSPLAAGTYGSVTAAAAALLAAPAGLDEAVTRCAANADCAAAQAIAAKVRAAETALSVLLLTAGAGVQRGTACQQAITDLSDAVVHRYQGRLDDFLTRTTAANAQRLDDALGHVGEVAATFKSACATDGG